MTFAQSPLVQSPYWLSLSQDDRDEFTRLRHHFHQCQKVTSKDPRLVCFANELRTILSFIEHSPQGRENRTILAGVAFAGPYICVNTRQLKNFLGRCKSSINGCFQQLGYVALKTKSKARTCVLSLVPSLVNDQNTLRQWTVRWASSEAEFCFVTSLTNVQLPNITDDDLNDERKAAAPRVGLAGGYRALPRTYSVPLRAPEPLDALAYAPPELTFAPPAYGFAAGSFAAGGLAAGGLDTGDDGRGDDWGGFPRSQSVGFGRSEQTHYEFDYFDNFI